MFALRLLIFCCLLSFLTMAHVAFAQTPTSPSYDTGPYEETKGHNLSNPRADFWRQVRDGMPGRVNIPDKEKGILIQQGGNDWLNTRSNVVANYGRQIIAVGLLLTLVFLFFSGHIRILSRPVGWAIDKLVPFQKIAHWVAALCFVLLGATGLNILYGKQVLAPMMGRVIFSEFSFVAKAIHNQASWLFMASIALVLVLRAREYLPGFVRQRVSRKSAMQWAQTGISEKVLFWFAVAGTLIVAYSGATLLIPNEGNEVRQMQLFQLMHSFSALTLTGLIVGNVYLIAVGVRENARKLLEAKEILEYEVQQRTGELSATNQKLAAEIEERRHIEDALKIAKEIAEQANLSKDKFLATASHDLLQPLTAARLMIATLRMRELKNENHEIVEQVHHFLRGTENLLTDLLDISSLGASTIEPKVTDFPVQQLLQGLESEFQAAARKNRLKLRCHCPDIYAKSDYQLLSRVLRNFLSNAIRYTHDGGVLLAARNRGKHIRIEVWDTGNGIPEDQLNRIFDEFHRLEPHKTERPRNEKGAGLGLAIVDRIAHILDHKINVRSRQGKGSVFSIDVPLGTQITHLRDAQRLEIGDLAGVVVAIVDNDESVLMALTTYLQEWGCSVLAGTTGDDLIEQLSWSSFSPDIILADYQLDAGLIGTDVVERVRRIYGHDLPAILISANHSEERRKSLAGAGYQFLSKPIRPAKMRALMSHLVNHEEHLTRQVRQSIGA